MRGRLIATFAAAAGLLLAASAAAQPPLPESLGLWYKPQAERQVWLHTMFAMRRELQAVREYAQQKDAPRLAKWTERLVAHYRRLPEMVPEWAEELELALADQLAASVAQGDFDATGRAADRLERDCRSCHRQYQALAALKYRWPRFADLKVVDETGKAQGYADHMERLSTSVNRIKIASEDDRWDAAHEALDALRGQLDALGGSCRSCHADDPEPHRRILGPATEATLEQLHDALAARDARTAGRHLGQAAVQVCARCHGVHRLLTDLQRELLD